MTELDGFDAMHSYRGHDLFLAWDISDDCMKRDYIVRLPTGEIRYIDWSPYLPLSERDFQRFIELGCPARVTCSPLRTEDLDRMQSRRQAA